MNFDGQQPITKTSVMTVASIKPQPKASGDQTAVFSMNNIQRASMASDNRPVLTKQKQKIISSQDRPRVFAQKSVNRNAGSEGGQKNDLLQRSTEQPRN